MKQSREIKEIEEVVILTCQNCIAHRFSTRHDPNKYEKYLRQSFINMNLKIFSLVLLGVMELVEAGIPEDRIKQNPFGQPDIGSFEIFINDKHIFSKLRSKK